MTKNMVKNRIFFEPLRSERRKLLPTEWCNEPVSFSRFPRTHYRQAKDYIEL
jgi:hypothetical protein